MCKLRNPRLQYNSLKIHFRHGHHLGNHEQPNTVERKQKKETSRNHIQIARRQQGWG
jgi:hypothetical protein